LGLAKKQEVVYNTKVCVDCDEAEGCQLSWGNFCGELSVLESGDEELSSLLFL
jgi:hypothetical protein